MVDESTPVAHVAGIRGALIAAEVVKAVVLLQHFANVLDLLVDNLPAVDRHQRILGDELPSECA